MKNNKNVEYVELNFIVVLAFKIASALRAKALLAAGTK